MRKGCEGAAGELQAAIGPLGQVVPLSLQPPERLSKKKKSIWGEKKKNKNITAKQFMMSGCSKVKGNIYLPISNKGT